MGPSKRALHAIRIVRTDFAHCAADPSLAEPRQQKRLQRVYKEARPHPHWTALEPLLQQPFAARATVRFPSA